MRKLKLQMQLTADGYVAGPQGEMDWMTWNWDEELNAYVDALTAPVGGILLGRHLAAGFIDTWAARTQDPGPEGEFARKMMDTPKVVFTKTLEHSDWPNTTLAKGDLAAEVKALKEQPGGDLIAYGGATFVASLIQAGLIDDYHLFINPAAIGAGMTIFRNLPQKQAFTLVESRAFACGVVVLHYQPLRS